MNYIEFFLLSMYNVSNNEPHDLQNDALAIIPCSERRIHPHFVNSLAQCAYFYILDFHYRVYYFISISIDKEGSYLHSRTRPKNVENFKFNIPRDF
jgi:hypothetical protein